MSKDVKPVQRVFYFRIDERTESGELIFCLQFYGFDGRRQKTMAVPAGKLQDHLDELRKQGIISQRAV
jgi:hypothetical protein